MGAARRVQLSELCSLLLDFYVEQLCYKASAAIKARSIEQNLYLKDQHALNQIEKVRFI